MVCVVEFDHLARTTPTPELWLTIGFTRDQHGAWLLHLTFGRRRRFFPSRPKKLEEILPPIHVSHGRE